MAISSARQFFERALAEGASYLRALVLENTHETEWLDFKGGDDLGAEQVKSLWSKAICGFANPLLGGRRVLPQEQMFMRRIYSR